MSKIRPYIYMITHIPSGQFYIGSRFRNVRLNRAPEDDLWVHYTSSSKIVNDLILIEGKKNFSAAVVAVFFDAEECYWEEQAQIKENIKNPLCLNKHFTDRVTAKSSFCVANIPKTPAQNKKISSAVKRTLREKKVKMTSEEKLAFSIKLKEAQTNRAFEDKLNTAEKISTSWQNRSQDEKQKFSEKRSQLTKDQFASMSDDDRKSFSNSVKQGLQKLSKEEQLQMRQKRKESLAKKSEEEILLTKQRWRNSNLNKSDEEKALISKKKSASLLNRSADQKAATSKKLSESLKGQRGQIVKCPHCGKEGSSKGMSRWHFDKCKHKT